MRNILIEKTIWTCVYDYIWLNVLIIISSNKTTEIIHNLVRVAWWRFFSISFVTLVIMFIGIVFALLLLCPKYLQPHDKVLHFKDLPLRIWSYFLLTSLFWRLYLSFSSNSSINACPLITNDQCKPPTDQIIFWQIIQSYRWPKFFSSTFIAGSKYLNLFTYSPPIVLNVTKVSWITLASISFTI